MFMFENQITIEDRPVLEEYLNGYDYQTSGLSFSSLYMWRNINGFSWQIIGDYMFLAGESHLEMEDGGRIEPFLFPPLTRTGSYEPQGLRQAIYEAKKIFEKDGCEMVIRLLPDHMIDIIRQACPEELEYIEDRPNYDYVYRRQDLAELKGRDYHGKKNHLNYFHKNYQFEYVPLTSDMAAAAMRFIEESNEHKEISEYEMQLLKMEEEAMADVFRNLEKVGYLAGAVLIDDKIEALTVGGNLNKDTVAVHVEKANTNFRGLYQAINNEFCKSLPSHVEYVNREEDMGIANLRKAKLSYKPVRMVEKYIAAFK